MAGHKARNIGLGILAVIIIAGILFYYLYLSGGVGSLAYAAITNPSSLKSAILNKVNSYPQFGVSYSGKIGVSVNYSGTDPTVYIPLNLSYLKYQNDERVSLMVGGLSLGGIGGAAGIALHNLSAIGISINNGSTVYACYGYNGGKYNCAKSNGSPTQIISNISNAFNFSGVKGYKVGSVLPGFYNGMPCWQASGNLTLSSQSQPVNGTALVDFSSCFSSQYYFPLTLTANISTKTGSYSISMAETNITQATNLSEVTALPGPLINAS